MKYKKKCFVFGLMFCLLAGMFGKGHTAEASENTWPSCPKLRTKSAALMDLTTGAILVSENEDAKEYPASITKVMTALLAIEQAESLDEKVTFTKEAVEIGDNESSSIGMRPGEEITLRDCLHALMLASANEVANAIAIHTSGSVEAFVELMNKRAEELGCTGTHFNNPSGLYDPDHYTTAGDMARIGREAIRHEEFREIAGKRSYVVPKTNLEKEERPVANHHQMVNPARFPQYAYEFCYAGKTGYTREAGFTLITFAKKGTMDLCAVIMGAGSRDDQYGSTEKLLNYGFKRFRMEMAEKISLKPEEGKGELFSKLRTKDPEAALTVSGSAMLAVPKKCDSEKITQEIAYEEIDRIEAGDNKVGNVSYFYEGKKVGEGELLYNSVESFSLLENEAGKKDGVTGEGGEHGEASGSGADTEGKGKLPFGKVSLVFGILLIVAALLIGFVYFRNGKRGFRVKKRYMHRKLKKSMKKKNRLKWK